MLKDRIDFLIAEAMKNKETEKVSVLRLIKTEFVKKEKEGKGLTDLIEANVLMKMVSQREDSIDQFSKANRMDLVEKEQRELDILKLFAPKQVSDEDIISETEKVISNMGGSVTMKDMKNILSEVQKVYPTANGKIISQVVKSHC